MAVPRFHRLQVLARLPHLGRGFTQGLIADGGTVWESTGLYGQSLLRTYGLGASRDDDCGVVPPQFWAEGICRHGAEIWQLTWQDQVALRWRTGPLTLVETVPFDREGWGICGAGDVVVTSDGSDELVCRDPRTLLTGKTWRSIYHVRLTGSRPRKDPARLLLGG